MNVTLNRKVVAVVPDPGLAVPFWIVTVPVPFGQVRARAGPALNPIAATAIKPARASDPASHSLDRPKGATARRPNTWAMAGG